MRFTALGFVEKAINDRNKKPINQSIKIINPFSRLRITLHITDNRNYSKGNFSEFKAITISF